MNDPNIKLETDPIVRIVGSRLIAVCFRLGYVKIQLESAPDHYFVSVLNRAAISRESGKVEFGGPGYRDALCEAIGKTIAAGKIEEHVSARLEFTEGITLEVGLRPEDYEQRAEGLIVENLQRKEFWVY